MLKEPTGLELRELRVEDEARFRRVVAAFEAEAEAEQPAFQFAFDYDPEGSFPAYVAKMAAWARGEELPQGYVPCTFLLGVVGDQIVGRLSLRHTLNAYLAEFGGHVGYGVAPSHRRRGYGKALLREALPLAARLGIERLLVTCDEDNAGSIRIIEANGGLFERITTTDDQHVRVPMRRYWIDLRRP